MTKDITFDIKEENGKFNFRVAAIITRNNKLLLQRFPDGNFYSFLGGRVQLFEDTTEALLRECVEEIGISFKREDVKLVDVIENLFTHNSIKYHEILFIYRIELSDGIEIPNELKTLDKENNYNYWIDYSDIENLNIKPVIIKDIYLNKELKHYINKEI